MSSIDCTLRPKQQYECPRCHRLAVTAECPACKIYLEFGTEAYERYLKLGHVEVTDDARKGGRGTPNTGLLLSPDYSTWDWQDEKDLLTQHGSSSAKRKIRQIHRPPNWPICAICGAPVRAMPRSNAPAKYCQKHWKRRDRVVAKTSQAA